MSASAFENVVNTSPRSVVAQLRERAQKDPLFKAIAHRFAKRERARAQITLSNLRLTMSREGVHYPSAKYEDVLKFLASLHLGKLEHDGTKIVALKDIRMTLQSIGQAALANTERLDSFNVGNLFHKLPVNAPKQSAAQSTIKHEYPVVLTVLIDEKIVNFPLPKAISSEQLGFLLADLYSNATQEPKGRS